VLVELGVGGAAVTGRWLEVLEEGLPGYLRVARRHQVARQTVHEWLARYAQGRAGRAWADRSSRPAGRARIRLPAAGRGADRRDAAGSSGVRAVPGSGGELERAGRGAALPGRSAVVPGAEPAWPGGSEEAQAAAGGLPAAVERGPGRWTCGQMDVLGRGVPGRRVAEVKIVTGIDDHSRFRGVREGSPAGHGPAGVPGAGRGAAPARDPRADPEPITARSSPRGSAAGPGPGDVSNRICARLTGSSTC